MICNLFTTHMVTILPLLELGLLDGVLVIGDEQTKVVLDRDDLSLYRDGLAVMV